MRQPFTTDDKAHGSKHKIKNYLTHVGLKSPTICAMPAAKERYRDAIREFCKRKARGVYSCTRPGRGVRQGSREQARSLRILLQIISPADKHLPGGDVALDSDQHLDFADDLVKVNVFVIFVITWSIIELSELAALGNITIGNS